MINLEEIQNQYPQSLRGFKRGLLREYLQVKILDLIFNSKFEKKLCFIGGTCLRILHGNKRFSEDLDFDNFDLSGEEFEGLSEIIKKGLELEGFEVNIRNVRKGAFRCYVKIPKLLFDLGLSGLENENLLILVDTLAQDFDFEPQKVKLNKFDVFTFINAAPLELILAEKFFTIFNRKRAKGRDFFDIISILQKTKKIDGRFLEQKMNIKSAEELKREVKKKCQALDFMDLHRDVQPFLFNPEDQSVLKFLDYVEAADLEFVF